MCLRSQGCGRLHAHMANGQCLDPQTMRIVVRTWANYNAIVVVAIFLASALHRQSRDLIMPKPNLKSKAQTIRFNIVGKA